VSEGCRQLAAGQTVLASDTLRDALALCSDEPLVEFAYAEFATGERARLQELVFVATESRIDADLALGRHREVVGELEALCAQHTLRERLWELQMLALYRSGRQADALRAYAQARDVLIEAFGLEPGPALRQLEARVLAQDPALDLPESRLPGSSPPRAGNLRERLSSFVGREDDIASLLQSIGSCRLVTLIGPGGAGKTRLAVEAAATVRDGFAGGVWLVELAGVRDPEGVAPAIAAALEIGRTDGAAGSTVDLIVSNLLDRSLLLVLDNCEHLVADAAAVVETLVGELPGLRVVATSREALGVPGEVLFPIRGLSLDAAVEVFADRARAVRPGFAVDDSTRSLVEDVCLRLDGLPLALELAAARLRALPLPQMVELLDDRFQLLTGGARTALPRQQTLRAVVDWSYDLLFDDERRLFARLSVFAGAWSLEAAEAVCSDDLLPPASIIDLVLHLVDKSLVVAEFDETGDARYSQLQTLWYYARERLAEGGEGDELRARHAAWYRTLAQGAREGLRGKTGPTWRTRLLAEWDNLRVALDWFAETGDAASALALTEGIAWLWFLRGDPHEAVRWLDEALAVPGAGTSERAGCSSWHAFFCAWMPDRPNPLLEMDAAIEVLRSGTPDRYVDALLMAADLRTRSANTQASMAVLSEARNVLESTGDDWQLALHDYLVCRNLAGLGEFSRAEEFAAASVARFRQVGEAWLIFEGLGVLAIVQEARGALEQASASYLELMELARLASMPDYEQMWGGRLASVRARQGDDAGAMELYAATEAAAVFPVNIIWAKVGRAGAARRLGDRGTAKQLLDEALELGRAAGLDLGCGAALTGLAWWALFGGDLNAATTFADEASRHAAVLAGSRLAGEAALVAAAVTCVRTGAAADRDAFLALVARRATRGAGGYDALLSGSIGEHFDAPDITALVEQLG
jgi:predicted ATPase